MVSHTDAVGINIATQLFEIRISEVAGSHFDADLMELGVGESVEMYAMKNYGQRFA